MTERLVITSMGHRGDGIAESAAGAIYIPYTLPGETIEVDAWPGHHPDRRHLIHVVEASAERIAPICPHFGVCGGCALQHWRTDRYHAWKRDLVVAALAQAGIEAEVGEIVDAHGEGRRRAVFHARRGTHDVLNVGFSALRAHEIVPIDRCPIFAPGLDGAIEAAWAIAEALDPTGKPLEIHATASAEGLDIDVRGSGPLKPDRLAALARVAEAHRLARLTRHGELVAQRAAPIVMMGKARVRLPPGAFLQATAAGEEALAARILFHVANARAVADLFAGVGPFALRIAERARVTAIDGDASAIAALTQAAATPGLKPVTATRRDLFRTPMAGGELAGIEAAVFDPPRQGGQAQARALAASKVATVVAVSCNPATFARDARILIDGGYRLDAVTPVDQFRYSAHVEIVARFRR